MARAMGMTDPVDPVPHESYVPIQGYPTLEERLHEFVEARLSQHALEVGLGSFEEEDDFDVDDNDGDPDLLTDYQVVLMPEDDDLLIEPTTPPSFPADQQAEGAPVDPAAAAAPVGTEGPADSSDNPE